MSSFIVSNATINRIVAVLEYATQWKRLFPNPAYINETLQVFSPKSAKDLGQRLYDLNVAAVNHRYPDTIDNINNMPGAIDENGDHVPYKYMSTLPGNRFQGLKAIDCLVYQCSEGDTINHPLYKALKEYGLAICSDIVGDMPEYENAVWDE